MSNSEPEVEGSSLQRPGVLIAAIGLALVLVVSVVILIASGDEGSDNAAPAPSPTSAPTASDGGERGGCPRLRSGGEPSERAPQVSWSLYRTVALPQSKATGPAHFSGDVARCYAHTPNGALVAAAQLSTRLNLAPAWEDVLERQTVGAGRAEYLKVRRAAERDEPAPEPEAGEFGQIAGYSWVTYTPSTAVVELVNRFGEDGVMQATTITLQWKRGDWHYEIPKTKPEPQAVDSLSGYTTWGGV